MWRGSGFQAGLTISSQRSRVKSPSDVSEVLDVRPGEVLNSSCDALVILKMLAKVFENRGNRAQVIKGGIKLGWRVEHAA